MASCGSSQLNGGRPSMCHVECERHSEGPTERTGRMWTKTEDLVRPSVIVEECEIVCKERAAEPCCEPCLSYCGVPSLRWHLFGSGA